MTDFVTPLEEARTANGLTQRELARRSGVGLRTIQRAENGETISRLKEHALAQALDDLRAVLFPEAVA
jgi:transcriptional regulator with XRE-family HTH domain